MAEAADNTLRACKHCNSTKPLTDFVRVKDVVLHKCRACSNAERRARYAAREGQYATVGTEEWKAKRKKASAQSYGRYVWEDSWLATLMSKACSRCRIELPANPAWFRRATNRKDGLSVWCRSCEARYYDENRTKRNKGQREYHRKRKEQEPEKLRENRRNWSAKNHAKKRWFDKEHRAQNIDLYRKRQVAVESKRRSRKRDSEGSFTAEDIAGMLAAQKGRCWYCSKALHTYHVEHRIPLSRGGTNGPENIVLACPPCNLSKGVKMPWEMESPRLL